MSINTIREIVESILESVEETRSVDDFGEYERGMLMAYYDCLLTIKEEAEADGIALSDVLLDFDLDKEIVGLA